METKFLSIFLITLLFISCNKEDVELMYQEAEPVTDIDGNTYKTVKIGDQIWMAENLKVTHFNDGTEIPLLDTDEKWKHPHEYFSDFSGYCWYDNNKSNKDIYGLLYKGYTIKTNKLCPAGWHIPSLDEWNVLINFLGGDSIAGISLKEKGNAHWSIHNYEANNISGFTALPGGYRDRYAEFKGINHVGYWWSSTYSESSTLFLWHIGLSRYFNDVSFGGSERIEGYSVRCVKDSN